MMRFIICGTSKAERMGCGTTLNGSALLTIKHSHGFPLVTAELISCAEKNWYRSQQITIISWELNQALERGNIDEKKYRAEAVSGEALISFLGWVVCR